MSIDLRSLAAEVEGAWRPNFHPPYTRGGPEHAFLTALAALDRVPRSDDQTGEAAAGEHARLLAGMGLPARLVVLRGPHGRRWGVETRWDGDWRFFDARGPSFHRGADPTDVLSAARLLEHAARVRDQNAARVRNEDAEHVDLGTGYAIESVLPETEATDPPPPAVDGLPDAPHDLDEIADAVRASLGPHPSARALALAAVDRVYAQVRPYLWSFLNLDDPCGAPSTVADTLRRGAGVCGNQINVFGELARRLGLEARRVQLFWRTPTGRATNHVCVEVRWDGAWHFLDLTHGAYFRNRQGDVASLDERLDDPTLDAVVKRATLFYQVNRLLGWDDPLDYLRPDAGLDRLHGGVGDLHPRMVDEPARSTCPLDVFEPLLGRVDDPHFATRGDIRWRLPAATRSVRWIDLRVGGFGGAPARVRATCDSGWQEAPARAGRLRIDVSRLETRGREIRLELHPDEPDAVSYLVLEGIELTPCWPSTPDFLLPPDTPDSLLRYDSIVVVQTAASPPFDAARLAGTRVIVLRADPAQTRPVLDVSPPDAPVVTLSVCPSIEATALHAELHGRGVMRPVLLIETLSMPAFVSSRFSPLKILHVTAAMRDEPARPLPGVDVAVVDGPDDRAWLEARGFTEIFSDLPLDLVPEARNDRLNVLFLYEDAWTHVSCIHDDLAAAARHLGHDVWFAPATVAGGEPGCPLDLRPFDVVIIHYAVRVSLPAYLSSEYAAALRAFGGYKVLFMQDDYETTETSRRWITDLGIHHVLTAVPPHGLDEIFPRERFPQVEFQHRSTGFVPDALEAHPRVPLRDRPLVLGYRGRELPWSYGRLARDKFLIGERMREICAARGVAADIACDEQSRVYGDAWIRFLESSRASLGTESGSNVFDEHGELRRQFELSRKADPPMDFEAFFEAHLRPHEGRVRVNQISPRVLEAVAVGTALVMFDGDYSGVVRPYEHFIPLANDFSNVDEVLARLDDLPSLEAMTERAWQHLVGSGLYTYRTFYQRLGRLLSRRVRHAGGRRLLEGMYASETADGPPVRALPRGAPSRVFYTRPYPYDRASMLDGTPPRRPVPVDRFELLTSLRPATHGWTRCDALVLISEWRDAERWDALLHCMADTLPVYAVVVGDAPPPRASRRGVQVVRASAAFTRDDAAAVDEALCRGGSIRPCLLTDAPAADAWVARHHAALRLRVEAGDVDPWDPAPFAARLAERLDAPPPPREPHALNLLLLYCDGATQVGCVRDDVEALLDLSAHRVFAAPASNHAPAVDLDLFDAVLLTYSVRLAHEAHLSQAYVAALQRFGGFKAAIITDEYEGTETARCWIERLGLHAVFTAVPPDFVERVYPRARFPRLELVHKLTGFVPAALEALDDLPPTAARPCTLGYRGRRLPFWYGELGHDKHRIGAAMREACEAAGLACDIEWDEQHRLNGPDWIAFHLQCKAVLASESGSRIFDAHGRVRERVEAWLAEHPDATFEEASRAFLADLEEIPMGQVSPRVFEAAATRTALVMFEGSYSGVLQAHEHYIPLRKDLANVDEVLARLRDDAFLEALTERAWRHVVGAGTYAYRRFCREFDAWLWQRAGDVPPRALTQAAVGWEEPDGTRHVADLAESARAFRFVLHWYTDVYPRSQPWQDAWYARQGMAQAEEAAAQAEAARAREAAEQAAREAAARAAHEAAEAAAREQAAREAEAAAAEAAARQAAIDAVPAWRRNGGIRWIDACVCRPFAMVWEYNRLMLAGLLEPGGIKRVPGVGWIDHCVFHPFRHVWEYNRLMLAAWWSGGHEPPEGGSAV